MVWEVYDNLRDFLYHLGGFPQYPPIIYQPNITWFYTVL